MRRIWNERAARAVAGTLVLAWVAVACGGGSTGGEPEVVLADDIPVAYTPLPGGYGEVMPPPILARCTEPLSPGAPDLRGLWETETGLIDGAPAPADHGVWQHVERVEQCGNRVVVTSSGVIHDMRADGTLENGVHDVSALNFLPIQVVATFEDGALVLRPVGATGFEVTRARDGEILVWNYGPALTVYLRRVDETS
jgi:hypothetical protein